MRFQGSFVAPVTCGILYSFVTDPRKLVTVIPDVRRYEVTDKGRLQVSANAGVGPVKGPVEMSFELTEKKPKTSATLRGTGKGMQSTFDLKLTLNIHEVPGGCRADWTAEVAVGGMLASVGGRLMGGVAERYVRTVTDDLRRKVAKTA